MKAVEAGLLSEEDALHQYHLGEDEAKRLQSQFAMHGEDGLKQTRRTPFSKIDAPDGIYVFGGVFRLTALTRHESCPVSVEIFVNDYRIRLTPIETSILHFLASKAGEVVSQDLFLDLLYSRKNFEPDMKIIDVYVYKIRKKLNTACPGLGQMIETVWGRGWIIKKGFVLGAAQKAA